MPIHHATFAVTPRTSVEQDEIARVDAMARKYLVHLESISAELDAAHVHGASSKRIQDIVVPWLVTEYGALPECSDGFEATHTRGNRADAQIPIPESPDRRVIVEVERGGPITNNHDLKDLWKAHLSPIAGHLFLIVPNSITNGDGTPRADRAFTQSQARLREFFADERTRIDVLSLHIFGYGPDPLSKAERKALRQSLRTSPPINAP